MKLLTKALEARFAEVGAQDVPDPIVIAKYFHPFHSWTWLAVAYDPDTRVFFGRVDGYESELGYFSLEEFEETRIHGLPFERDLHWTERPLSQCPVKR